MKFTRSTLCTSILAILAAAHSATGMAAQQDTQEQPTDEETEVITVSFTGTSIRGAAPVGSSLIELDRSTIDNSGSINTVDILRETPQVFSLGVNDASRNGNGGSSNIVYGNAVNIRGIGPYATLTLLNGRRMVPQGSIGATVDPSTIPSIALKRVEIIADGASAIYGSDAVAGVANLILRRNVEGAEVQAQYGTGSDYNEYQIGAIAGKTWDSGQVTVAFQNSYRSKLEGRDRDFYRADQTDQGGGDYRVTSCSPGNLYLGGETYAIPAGGATADNLVAGTLNRCDIATNYTDLLPELEFLSGVITYNQDITDNLSFFTDVLMTRRDGQRDRTPNGSTFAVPETNAFFVAPAGVPLDPCPASSGVGADVGCVRVDYSFDQPVSSTYNTETWQITSGIDYLLPGDWLLNAFVTYGENTEDTFEEFRGINTAALVPALSSSDPNTALNLFNTSATNPAVIDDVLNSHFVPNSEGKLFEVGAKVDGTLFSLPGGDMKLAAGVNYVENDVTLMNGRGPRENIAFRDNPLSRDVTSFFTELYVPLIGDGNSMPGVQSLVLNIAGRIDDYSDVGRTENPKLGLDWEVNDNLAFHASYGESFRAPLLTQVYSPSGSNFYAQNYYDPTVDAVVRGVAFTGNNLDLVPETAETFSLGIDYKFEALPGATMSINYFDVVYEGQISGQLANLNILRQEDVYGSLILRGEAATARVNELIASGTRVLGPVDDVLNTPVLIDGRGNNLGTTETSGIDFSVSVPFQTDVGDFKATVMGTWFESYKVAQTPTSPLVDEVNHIEYPMRLRTRSSISWMRDGWHLIGYANYINDYTNTYTGDSIDSFTTYEFSATYTFDGSMGDFTKDLKVGLFIRNLTDEEPPFVDIAPSLSGGGGYDPQVANPIGRVATLSVSKAF
ncbi:TonB-dependent receptor plug domain-containing protein [Alteromonas lipolytica]|uniref:TonB-dependent receptor n=1 Tax=Alteromonas lipolytica TaxID=1856405 RepID=A0A1E8FC44_9ALTE|nr:TonB-dependent receptor [Alteromonas lipolytica]OFI33492.1 hypothetical protein BFC17_04320 [Alteromonas lipolytica]GGF59215.1 TonB-dependent receptor [Alteromonas lipolytica]